MASLHSHLWWLLTDAGEDLLVASADKPFRFPATFTFVVRSFTVLDGIGKGLDPRFDISEIAAPYARGLLLEGNPQYAALAKDFRRRLGLQVGRSDAQRVLCSVSTADPVHWRANFLSRLFQALQTPLRLHAYIPNFGSYLMLSVLGLLKPCSVSCTGATEAL